MNELFTFSRAKDKKQTNYCQHFIAIIITITTTTVITLCRSITAIDCSVLLTNMRPAPTASPTGREDYFAPVMDAITTGGWTRVGMGPGSG